MRLENKLYGPYTGKKQLVEAVLEEVQALDLLDKYFKFPYVFVFILILKGG